MIIRIGIHTDGEPSLATRPDGTTMVRNAMIGVGFHWQRQYPLLIKGKITTGDFGPGEPQLVCGMDLEDYIRSVVSSEMNPDAPPEFIKAHAIISRSWAIRSISNPHDAYPLPCSGDEFIKIYDNQCHRHFDLCNDDHCQRFQGEGAVTPASAKAVAETAGMILTDADGSIADARYSKCCGGKTEVFSTCWQDTDKSYLRPVDDPWCDLSGMADSKREAILRSVLKDYDRTSTPDFHRWKRIICSTQTTMRIQNATGIDVGEIVRMTPVSKGPSGRISKLCITGTLREIVIGKELFIRKVLAEDCLLSSAFDIEKRDDGFILHGKGWGHGVGLCQTGAAAMAFDGRSASEILSHYYPGTKIKKI